MKRILIILATAAIIPVAPGQAALDFSHRRARTDPLRLEEILNDSLYIPHRFFLPQVVKEKSDASKEEKKLKESLQEKISKLQFDADIGFGDAKLWVRMGRIKALQGDIPGAIGAFYRALAAGGEETRAILDLVELYYRTGNIHLAISRAGRLGLLTELTPGDIDEIVEQIRILNKEGHFILSRALIEAALETEPDNLRLRMEAGKVLFTRKNISRAITYFSKIVKDFPDSGEAHNLLGQAYISNNLLEDAKNEFNQARRLEPFSYKIWVNLGSVYFLLRQFDRAEKAYLTAAGIEPDETLAYYNLACLDVRQGDLESGLLYLEKAIDNGFIARNVIKTDPDLMPLRRHPDFIKLLHRTWNK